MFDFSFEKMLDPQMKANSKKLKETESVDRKSVSFGEVKQNKSDRSTEFETKLMKNEGKGISPEQDVPQPQTPKDVLRQAVQRIQKEIAPNRPLVQEKNETSPEVRQVLRSLEKQMIQMEKGLAAKEKSPVGASPKAIFRLEETWKDVKRLLQSLETMSKKESLTKEVSSPSRLLRLVSDLQEVFSPVQSSKPPKESAPNHLTNDFERPSKNADKMPGVPKHTNLPNMSLKAGEKTEAEGRVHLTEKVVSAQQNIAPPIEKKGTIGKSEEKTSVTLEGKGVQNSSPVKRGGAEAGVAQEYIHDKQSVNEGKEKQRLGSGHNPSLGVPGDLADKKPASVTSSAVHHAKTQADDEQPKETSRVENQGWIEKKPASHSSPKEETKLDKLHPQKEQLHPISELLEERKTVSKKDKTDASQGGETIHLQGDGGVEIKAEQKSLTAYSASVNDVLGDVKASKQTGNRDTRPQELIQPKEPVRIEQVFEGLRTQFSGAIKKEKAPSQHLILRVPEALLPLKETPLKKGSTPVGVEKSEFLKVEAKVQKDKTSKDEGKTTVAKKADVKIEEVFSELMVLSKEAVKPDAWISKEEGKFSHTVRIHVDERTVGVDGQKQKEEREIQKLSFVNNLLKQATIEPKPEGQTPPLMPPTDEKLQRLYQKKVDVTETEQVKGKPMLRVKGAEEVSAVTETSGRHVVQTDAMNSMETTKSVKEEGAADAFKDRLSKDLFEFANRKGLELKTMQSNRVSFAIFNDQLNSEVEVSVEKGKEGVIVKIQVEEVKSKLQLEETLQDLKEEMRRKGVEVEMRVTVKEDEKQKEEDGRKREEPREEMVKKKKEDKEESKDAFLDKINKWLGV